MNNSFIYHYKLGMEIQRESEGNDIPKPIPNIMHVVFPSLSMLELLRDFHLLLDNIRGSSTVSDPE